MNWTAKPVLIAALSITALAMAAATFDSVNRPAPDAAAPGANPDSSTGSAANGTAADSSSSLGGLATPFEWRADLDSDAPSPDSDGLGVPLALALLVVCAVGVVALLTGSDYAPPDREREDDVATDSTDATGKPRWSVGADENAVYRSWRRLADRLDAAPTCSPAEIAATARDRGFDGQVVSELMAAFREVRYGGRPATGEREERATDALDRLEDDA